MGFGFNLLFAFVLFPLFILSIGFSFLIVLFSPREKRYRRAKRLLYLYVILIIGFFGVMIALMTLGRILSPMNVQRDDVIGTYRVDRNMYPGMNADWQYEHFVLEIQENNTVALHSKDICENWNVFKRRIIPMDYANYRWRFPSEGDTASHHVLSNTPSLYRERWNFYYVFRSPRFGNMFFRKD